jgi:hypothetical protein
MFADKSDTTKWFHKTNKDDDDDDDGGGGAGKQAGVTIKG